MSDHEHCVNICFQQLVATSSATHGFRTTFSNRFTFFATDSEFPATISLFLHRLTFFAINPQQCCNNCSNNCFLSDYSTTLWREGVLSGSLGTCGSGVVSLFGDLFFCLFSCTHFFTNKSHFSQNWYPKWLQNPPQTWPWPHFLQFSGNLVLDWPYIVFTTF